MLDTVEEFDPSTDHWVLRASIPTPRSSPAVGEIQGEIYVFGGSGNTSESIPEPLAVVEEGVLPVPGSVLQIPTGIGVTTGSGQVTIRWNSVSGATSYDLYMSSDSGLNKNNYSMKRTGVTSPFLVTGLTNGKTYYFFVTAADAKRESEESYEVSATPTAPPDLLWATRSEMPTPKLEPGVAVVNGEVYVIGGYSGSTLSTVEEYDPATDTWTSKADMPTPRRAPVVAMVNNKIYAIGGMNYTDPDEVTYTFVTEEYDPATDTWTSKTSIPAGTPFNSVLGNFFMGGAAANGKIYVVVFNTNGFPSITSTFEYDPASDVWATKSPVPFSYTQYAVASLNDKIYVLASSSFAAYDPLTDIWTIKTSLPSNRSLAGLIGVASKNKIYAVGGIDSSLNILGSIEEYDPLSNMWTARASMPTPRYSLGTGEVGGMIFIIGGSDNPDTYAPLPLPYVEEGG